MSQACDQDEITNLILDFIAKRVGEADPMQTVLGTRAPFILDGLVGATAAVIAGAVPPENWRLVAAGSAKAEQDGRQSH